MIQVAAFVSGLRPNHPARGMIEIELSNPLAEDLTAGDTAARMACYDWNRISEAMPLKSSTL
jgi:hypothetical protein